jgi:hypothetical protein
MGSMGGVTKEFVAGVLRFEMRLDSVPRNHRGQLGGFEPGVHTYVELELVVRTFPRNIQRQKCCRHRSLPQKAIKSRM